MLAPQPALFAWGDHGHETIGVIAYSRLTAPVKMKVDALLAADKDNFTAADFVSRTTWADKYRDSDRSTSRVRYEATRNWHFINIDIASGKVDPVCARHALLPKGRPASAGPAQACIVDKIDQFIAELGRPSTLRGERILALKFLLHLIGDLHQPLHVANNNDRGGNETRALHGDLPTNLHSYWDHLLVERLGGEPRAAGKALHEKITDGSAERWSKGTLMDWAKDSFSQGKGVAYNFTGLQRATDDHGIVRIRLDSVYEQRALPLLREQLAKAGVRLAAVLNSALR